MGVVARLRRLLLALAMLASLSPAILAAAQTRGGHGDRRRLHPVVVVPGYGTNEIDAQLTQLYRPSSSPRCGAQQGNKGWFRLYINQTALRDPAGVACFAEQMSSVYDPASGDYYNAPGVETRVPFFGSVRGLRFPNPDNKSFSYMDEFVTHLERMGYRDGETLFGAPYDFRYTVAAPGHRARVGSAFYARLRGLVETASRLNGGAPVILVTHSMGGPLTYHFLLRQPLAWRRRLVRRFVPVAAPWGGVVSVMYALVHGSNMGLTVDARALRREFRSLQTSLWLLPTPRAFGEARPLVTTRSRNYSAGDMAAFLAAAGLPEAAGLHESRVAPMFRDLPPPRVPVACVVGVGVDTLERMVYAGDALDGRETPAVVTGDGDGLVNLASLVAVEPAWRRGRGAYFRMDKLRNVSHTDVLKDERALDVIISAILRPNLS